MGGIERRQLLLGMGLAAVATAMPWRSPAYAAEPFEQPPLPYPEDALAPAISPETVALHYGKHHAGYFKELNSLAQGTPYAEMTLEQVVVAAAEANDTKIFNQAGQAWNHVVYWEQFEPGGAARFFFRHSQSNLLFREQSENRTHIGIKLTFGGFRLQK